MPLKSDFASFSSRVLFAAVVLCHAAIGLPAQKVTSIAVTTIVHEYDTATLPTEEQDRTCAS